MNVLINRWHNYSRGENVINISVFDCMQDTFARATHSAKRARDDRVSCIQRFRLTRIPKNTCFRLILLHWFDVNDQNK